MAPESLYVKTPKNVAADGTCLLLNCDHRVTEIGRTTTEYASG